MSIQQEVRNSWHDSIIELFELDLESITGEANDKYYFTGDIFPDGTKIQWQGEVYEPFPINITGFETTTKGTIPQPELTVANVLGTLASATNAFDDLVGAKITRRRTLGKYLDNGTNPDASEEFPKDVYYIERKTSETSLSISWQLASKIDLEGLQIPRRIVTQNYCVWEYRGSECGYDGPPLADDRDRPLTGDGSGASTNYINALNAFSTARSAARNAQNVLNLARGQAITNCDATTLPILETYSKLTGPDYSFAIVADGEPLFGIVEGTVVDIRSPNRDYRATRSIRGSFSGGNSIGPLRQIDLLERVEVAFGDPEEPLRPVASFYSETFPISFAYSEPTSEPGVTISIGILNGHIVSLEQNFSVFDEDTGALLETNGTGYYAGEIRRASLNGIFAIGLIDKAGVLCAQSGAAVSAAEAAFAAATNQLNSAQAAFAAAAAALPSGGTIFQKDVCGKRLNSCKLRFGGIDLPFGAFPGANLSR